MKKPEQPFKSSKYFYKPKYKVQHLRQKKTYVHPDYIEQYEDSLLDEEDLDENEKVLSPDFEEWWYNTELFTLQDLIDLSQGLDPKNVIISLHRDRDVWKVDLSIEHRANLTKEELKAWQEAKDAEEAKYQKELKIYEREKATYEKWEAEKQIEELQKKLKGLK